jgi:hypothetical protein
MAAEEPSAEEDLAHLATKYSLAVFPPAPHATERTTVISMHWFTTTSKAMLLSGLNDNQWKNLFPRELHKTIRPYPGHPCPRLAEVAAEGNVYDFGAALLTEIFLACRSTYKRLARAQQKQHADAGTVPRFVQRGIDNAGSPALRQEHRKLWTDLTDDQKAALLLFTNPPVRRRAGKADKDACVTLYQPGEYR